MIEKPPQLTVKRPVRRPTSSQIAAFQNVPTSFVVDALMGGHTLDRRIRPLAETQHFAVAGPALTAENGPGSLLALLGALDFVQAGDVIVNAVAGYQGCAALGDRVAGFAKNAGAAAIVTDGPARDYPGLREVGLPIWCTGLCPNTPHDQAPGRIGLPLTLGGQAVDTGDMIVADFDGVVVVPFEKIDPIIAKLEIVKELEAKLDAELQNGLAVPPSIKTLLASDSTRYVE